MTTTEREAISVVVNLANIQKKNFDSPDETRSFDKSRVELVKVGDSVIGRGKLEPGCTWESCVKPTVKTDSCQLAHTQVSVFKDRKSMGPVSDNSQSKTKR